MTQAEMTNGSSSSMLEHLHCPNIIYNNNKSIKFGPFETLVLIRRNAIYVQGVSPHKENNH